MPMLSKETTSSATRRAPRSRSAKQPLTTGERLSLADLSTAEEIATEVRTAICAGNSHELSSVPSSEGQDDVPTKQVIEERDLTVPAISNVPLEGRLAALESQVRSLVECLRANGRRDLSRSPAKAVDLTGESGRLQKETSDDSVFSSDDKTASSGGTTERETGVARVKTTGMTHSPMPAPPLEASSTASIKLSPEARRRMRRRATKRLPSLPDFATVAPDYDSLETYFMAFEQQAKDVRVRGKYLYELFLIQIGPVARDQYAYPYRAEGGERDYLKFRDWILKMTGMRHPAGFYLDKIENVPKTEPPMLPSELNIYITHVRLKYRRALLREGEMDGLTEKRLADIFLRHCPTHCQRAVHSQISGPSDYTFSKVVQRALWWEQGPDAPAAIRKQQEAQIVSTPTLALLLRRGVTFVDALSAKKSSTVDTTQNRNNFQRSGPDRKPKRFAGSSSKRANETNIRGCMPPAACNSPPLLVRKQVDDPEKGIGQTSASTTTLSAKAQTTNRNASGERSADRPVPVCYQCNRPGHIRRTCPLNVNSVFPVQPCPFTFGCGSHPYPFLCQAPAIPGPGALQPEASSVDCSEGVVPQSQVVTENGNVTTNVPVLACGVRFPTAYGTQLRRPEGSRSQQCASSSQLPPFPSCSGVSRSCKVMGNLLWPGDTVLSTCLLLDTGAVPNLVRADLVPSTIRLLPMDPNYVFVGPDNTKLNLLGHVTAEVVIGSSRRRASFLVHPDLTCNVLLGLDFIKNNKLVLDFASLQLTFPGPPPESIPLLAASPTPSSGTFCYARHDVVLPPRSCSMISVTFPLEQVHDMASDPAVACGPQEHRHAFFVQATQHSQGLMLPNAITSGMMEVTNLSERPLHVSPRFPLSTCIPVAKDAMFPVGSCLRRMLRDIDKEIAADGMTTEIMNSSSATEDSRLPDLTKAAAELGPEAAELLRELCLENIDLFSDGKKELSATTLFEAPIEVAEGACVSKPPYRQSLEQKKKTREQIKELLELGVISRSTSPWSSPITIVRKKDGSPRFCVDFREVNKTLSVPSYPLPRIDDVLQCFEGKKFFSVLDLVSGFWQIPIRKEDRHKTAFVTSDGLFEWNRLPFGLASSPAYFQKLMDLVIAGMKWTCAIAYIDDIIIYSDTLEHHMADLRRLFVALRAANLKLKPQKCILGAAEVHYLGHIVSRNGISPNPDKTRAIDEFPVPRNVTELRRFLGLAQYYRRFIRDFSQLAFPLFGLLKKDVKFHWSTVCSNAFNGLKKELTSSPVLAHPDLARPFIIECDASSVGFGAVLMQRDDKDEERVIAYASKSLTPYQRKWTATELEAGALIYALETFRTYISGNKTLVRTDHSPLPWLRQNKDKSYKLTRWVLRLQEFDIEIQHKSGRRMPHVDALSRAPIDDDKAPIELDVFPERAVLLVQLSVDTLPCHVIWNDPARSTPLWQAFSPVNFACLPYLKEHVRAIHTVASASNDTRESNQQNGAAMSERDEESAGDNGENALTEEAPQQTGDQCLWDQPPEPPFLARTELTTAQENDPFCVKLRSYLHRLVEDQPPWIIRLHPAVVDGLLTVTVKKGKPVVVLPASLREQVIFTHHLAYYAGHFGVYKTVARLALRYYWPRMKRHVKAFIAKCMFCLTYKPKYKMPTWLQLPLGVPCEIVAMDLYGPLPVTLHRHEYILALLDHHTRWCELVPLRQTTVEDIACALHTYWFSRFGVPRVLLSDNGPQFTAALLARLCKVYGIRRVFSTPYHPRGNSIVESFMRSIRTALHLVHVVGERRWDELLPAAAMAYRSTPHSSTGFSPFFLLTGTEMVLPLSRSWDEPYSGFCGPQWLRALWECRQALIRQHSAETRRRLAIVKKEGHFPIGSWVGIRRPAAETVTHGNSSKFLRQFVGPYRVLRQLPNQVSYEIQDYVTGITRKVNRLNLKLYDLPSESPPAFPDLPRCLLGVPPLHENQTFTTAEEERLRADLLVAAEAPWRPLSEGLPILPTSRKPAPCTVPESARGLTSSEHNIEGLQRQQQTLPTVIEGGFQSVSAPADARPLRATIMRRARVGDPSSNYRFYTLSQQ